MATSPADRRRWDGPFDKGSAMNFLVRMPVGAAAQLYRHSGDLIGWLEKVRGGRFATGGFAQAFADGALQNPVPEGNVDRHGAAEAVAQASPDYVVHDSLWQKGSPPERPTAATPELHEAVRLRVEDPGSGADPVLERRKLEHFHWREGTPGVLWLEPYGLAHCALRSLGFRDVSDEVAKELAPTVTAAFDAYERERPGLGSPGG